MISIAIFASGSGSNAQAFIDFFAESNQIKIALIISNKTDAGVLIRAEKHHIPTAILTKNEMQDNAKVLNLLAAHRIDFIVLAGYLLLIPEYLIAAYPNKIVNIHPALLPKYGGKGMHGKHVHDAVYAAKEAESGITIHYVNNEYDKGNIIYQAKTALSPTDLPETIAAKVLQLEHYYYPRVVEKLLLNVPIVF